MKLHTTVMKLHIDFDNALVLKHYNGSPHFFTIYWTSGQDAYPEEAWMDFGEVVLSWWLVTARQLVDGAQGGDLFFMDGPFRLRLSAVGDKITVSAADLDRPWRVTLDDLVLELLTGAKCIQSRLEEQGLADKEGLQAGVIQLETAIDERQRQKYSDVARQKHTDVAKKMGRPVTIGIEDRVTFYVTNKTIERLVALCEREGVTRSEAMRRMLDEYLNAHGV